MALRWRLADPLREIVLVPAGTESLEDRKHAMAPREASTLVRAMLSGRAGSSLQRRDIESLCIACGDDAPPASRRSGDAGAAIARVVGDALARGRIVAVARERRRVIVPVEALVAALGPEAEASSWVVVTLVDQDGDPVVEEPYTLEDPSGRVWKGTTDTNGTVRLDSIDPGNCKLSFPYLPSDWAKA